MSSITPALTMPANGASPSGMLTTSNPFVRVQAILTIGAADLFLIKQLEGGQWIKVPKAVIRLDANHPDGASGEILIANPTTSTNYFVLQEGSGSPSVYLAGCSSPVTVGDLSLSNLAASGTLSVTGAATLSSTLSVAGASTLTGAVTLGADMVAGSHKITGLAAGSAAGHSVRWEQAGMLAGALSTGTIGAATKYMNRGAAAVASSAVCIATVTRTGILRNLYANLLTAPGGTDTVAFTIQKSSDNGTTWTDLSLTCTITGTAKGANDTTHNPAVSAGDLLAVKMVSSATTASDPSVGFEIL